MDGRPPNIVLVNCDDLGYGDLGCYGSTVNKTPAIDRMCREGMRFSDFYMASPVCSPSRGAMLTGCYPPRIGFDDFDGDWVLFPGHACGLNPQEETMASLLKNRGYATMLVGKWHCGDQKEFLPAEHGFDNYYGIPYSNDMGRQRGREDRFPPLPLLDGSEVIQEQPDQRSVIERYAEQSVRFMRTHADQPFFLYLAHMQVHLPLYAPERFVQDAANGDYGAAVEAVDWAMAVLLHELEQLGLAEDTLVVFTSDNGSRGDNGGSNGPLRGRKGTTWEGGMRVPCLMYWPGTIEPGSTCRELTTALDFLPTFAAVTGAELPEKVIDGIDFSHRIGTNQTSGTQRQTFFYYIGSDLEAVRHRHWKLHVHKRGQGPIQELYDLSKDAGETTNVYGQHPEVVRQLEELLKQCRKDLGDRVEGAAGEAVRPKAYVQHPRTLTHYDPNHPYIVAMYDKEEAG